MKWHLSDMQNIFFDSPADLLASLSIQAGNVRQLLLVSAPSGAGKTHWCLQLADRAFALGYEVAGLASPAVFAGNRKVRIDLVDLGTGVRRCLAIRRGENGSGLLFGDWEFDPAALAWGNARLDSIRHCQVLVLDELGPLEFEHQAGFTRAFALIDSPCYQLACVVVRPALLPRALERWPWAKVLELPSRKPCG